ncbi:hypothetical protein GCM10009748_30840 [Agromyces lapidis]
MAGGVRFGIGGETYHPSNLRYFGTGVAQEKVPVARWGRWGVGPEHPQWGVGRASCGGTATSPGELARADSPALPAPSGYEPSGRCSSAAAVLVNSSRIAATGRDSRRSPTP